LPKLNKYSERITVGSNQYALRIDLDEIFGTAFPNSSRLRQAVGQDILDIIIKRTKKGDGWEPGDKFDKYSKEYSESLEFQAAGKSRGKPNLTLTGDMLGLMDIIEEDKATITIGWRESEEAQKAHGHISGNVGVKRDFLGISEKEARTIKERWEDAIREATAETGPARSSVQTLGQIIAGEQPVQGQTLGSILNNLFGEDNG
jgi:hypothetical protein